MKICGKCGSDSLLFEESTDIDTVCVDCGAYENSNGWYFITEVNDALRDLQDSNQEPKTRVDEWLQFSSEVHQHIEGYTIGQYKDKGEDTATEFSYSNCMENIRRYVNRYKSNARDGQNLLDLKKIAHYACIGYFKFINEEKEFTEPEIPDILKENEKKIKNLLGLMNSMILSGEQHSQTSKDMLDEVIRLFGG